MILYNYDQLLLSNYGIAVADTSQNDLATYRYVARI